MLDGLIDRLEREGWYDSAAAIRAGRTVEEAILAEDVDPEAVAVSVEKWRLNRKTKDRKKRQRRRLQVQLAEVTSERNRARRDRDTLTVWIAENGGIVTGKSGQRIVEAPIYSKPWPSLSDAEVEQAIARDRGKP